MATITTNEVMAEATETINHWGDDRPAFVADPEGQGLLPIDHVRYVPELGAFVIYTKLP